jgi:hypothetical protein
MAYEQRGVRLSDAKIRAFIKIEALVKLLGDGRLSQEIVPRIIQPRNPRLPVYGYALGRYIKIYEHLMKDALRKIGTAVSGFNFPVVLKGLDPRKRASIIRAVWDSFEDPICVSMDASRFDQHTSRDALVWEGQMWLCCCPYEFRDELNRLLNMQLRNRCLGIAQDGLVHYNTDGCRMSGDANTSAGNCLIMSAMLLTYTRERNVPGHVLNDGDDSMVIMERKDLEKFSTGLTEWFLECGYNMVVEAAVDVFERIDFCQCSPVSTYGGWTMVRNPHKALAKDLSHVTNFAHDADVNSWLSAVGECGRALTDGVPVYQAFYSCFDPKEVTRLPEELKDRGFYHMARNCRWENTPVTDESRVSFYKAFGITPDEQRRLETRWKNYRLADFTLAQSADPNTDHRESSPIMPRW